MLKKYLSDIAFMQILNLLIKPIWILFIDAAVQEALPDVYGNYFGLLTFSLLFFIVLDFGLNSFNATSISKDNAKISKLTGSIIGFKIVLSILYIVLVFGVGYLTAYSSAEFHLLIFLCVIQIITSFNQFFRSIVSGLQRFKWDGVFMVLDRMLLIVFCSILLWGEIEGWELTIERFVYAQILGLVVVCLMLVFFLRTYLSGIKVSFNLGDIMPILIESWPFAILISLMGLYNYVDGVMLERIIGDSEAYVYAMGYRFYFALFMFAQVFSQVLLPFFSKNLENLDVVKVISGYTFKLLFLVGIILSLLAVSYGMEILTWRFPLKADNHSVLSFQILLFGFIGSAFILVYGTLLTAATELRFLNFSAFITVVINWVLNLFLIPIYGAVGAAIATTSSQLLFGGMCYLLSFRKFDFQLNIPEIVKQVLGVILLFIAIVFGKQYLDNVVVHFSMITVTALLVGYLFRLYNAAQLKSLIRK